MADAGFSITDTVDLLASHSVAAQDHVDPTIPVSPLFSAGNVGDLPSSIGHAVRFDLLDLRRPVLRRGG
jgi:hypothetical protein